MKPSLRFAFTTTVIAAVFTFGHTIRAEITSSQSTLSASPKVKFLPGTSLAPGEGLLSTVRVLPNFYENSEVPADCSEVPVILELFELTVLEEFASHSSDSESRLTIGESTILKLGARSTLADVTLESSHVVQQRIVNHTVDTRPVLLGLTLPNGREHCISATMQIFNRDGYTSSVEEVDFDHRWAQ
ncbi:MAG: hypothetical protein ACU843_12610 [Gammaproteobacteria bacterium]